MDLTVYLLTGSNWHVQIKYAIPNYIQIIMENIFESISETFACQIVVNW